MAICVRRDLLPLLGNIPRCPFPVLGKSTLIGRDVLPLHLPPLHEQCLLLTQSERETYSDARYCKQATSKHHTLQHRIKGPYGHLGTVMAKYGSQHTLHPSALLRSGLHADLTGSLQRPRFFSPLELALALATFGTLKLPRNCRSAHHMVGNAISPMQALQVLLPIMCLLTKTRICAPVSHPQDILMNAWRLRLRASQTNVIESASWIGLVAAGSSSPAESHSVALHAISHARENLVPESIADDRRRIVSDTALSQPLPRNGGVLSTQVLNHPSEIVCSLLGFAFFPDLAQPR